MPEASKCKKCEVTAKVFLCTEILTEEDLEDTKPSFVKDGVSYGKTFNLCDRCIEGYPKELKVWDPSYKAARDPAA